MDKADEPMADTRTVDDHKDKEDKESEEESTVLSEIRSSIDLLIKAADSGEEHLTTRALRFATGFRRQLTPEILVAAVSTYIPEGEQKKALLAYFKEISVESAPGNETKTNAIPAIRHVAESMIYIQLLVALYLLDSGRLEETMNCTEDLLKRCHTHHKHTLSHLNASAWFYNARVHELLGSLGDLRPRLFAALRTASLHRDKAVEATVINLLLRSYLNENLYEQADKLIAKTSFPEKASIGQIARYYYYVGRIRAVQLDYTESFGYLQQALRKSPETGAVGFKLTVSKMMTVVQLLMGDIPRRSTLDNREMEAYFSLTVAVRAGDPIAFIDAVKRYKESFEADSTYTLVMRLHHNVIKTGLRRINLSYSRISLAAIASKLGLESADDAEAIVAKAIKDGVITAVINHDEGWITSKAVAALHVSSVPMDAYHKRIEFCLKMHADAVKAMQYPPHAHRDHEEEAERKERLAKETEMAQDVADGKWDPDADDEADDFI